MQRIAREQFDALCQSAILSAHLAVIAVMQEGGTQAEAVRAGIRAAFAFAIGNGLVQVSAEYAADDGWFRISVRPEEVFK